jgi:hypothetical protein
MTKEEEKELEKIKKITGNHSRKETLSQLKKKYPERKNVVFGEEQIGKDFVWKCL